ncbi:hypothetical protein AAGV28_02590 [Flavobacterium sp. FZUC8N2.13]|uniref:DUF6565 domain-containing protein n=1 Tax=Flavobacterium zubiriense TaxID=3138075 RepID=A0ABV4T8H7_9FLAO
MKNLNRYLTLIALAVIVTSCKDEKQELANQKVEDFKKYVDSINDVATEKTSENWEIIQAKYDKTKTEAQEAIDQLENKMDMDSIMLKTNNKYEEYKAKVILEKDAIVRNNFRNSFFTTKVNDDMKFEWVNKDNIADVYSNFVNTAEKNKDSYSRENWDEIKLLYEALDTRKNTVEKEGLSSKNNIKIAGLKIKFATMYRINRASAKSNENIEAKE